MPSTIEILNGLRAISNDFVPLAIIWHIIIYLLLLSFLLKLKFRNNFFIMLLSFPALSVSILAFMSGNPFNGIMFLLAFALIIYSGLKASAEQLKTSSLMFLFSGIIMLLFGLWYPHFANINSYADYLYAAPTGLIPCPTLSVIIGFALIFNSFNSKRLSLILICFGLFYGLFGIFRLGVYLDIVLLAGTIIFLTKYLMKR